MSSLTVFPKKYKNLFRGYTFKFEGLELCILKEFEELVTRLGGEVREDAVYTFVDASTYVNVNVDKKVYNICYILHSVRAKKPVDIEIHRFYKTKTCEFCLKEFENDSSSDEMDENSPHNNGEIKLIDEARIKIESLNKSNKNIPNNVSIESKKIKTPKRNSTNFERLTKNFKKLKTGNDKNGDLQSLPKFELNASVKNYNQKNFDSSKNIVMNPMASTSKTTSKLKKEKKLNLIDDSSRSSLSDLSSDEDTDQNNKEWWLPQQILKHQCKIPSCSLEPEPHLRHNNFSRNLSLIERRTIMKYLINTNNIQSAKGIKIFVDMNQSGYLTHRSAETLRNCLRRRILPSLHEYNLPLKIEEKFRALI